MQTLRAQNSFPGSKDYRDFRETGPRAPSVNVSSSTATNMFYESIMWSSTVRPVLIFKNNIKLFIICANNAFSYSSVANNLQAENEGHIKNVCIR